MKIAMKKGTGNKQTNPTVRTGSYNQPSQQTFPPSLPEFNAHKNLRVSYSY